MKIIIGKKSVKKVLLLFGAVTLTASILIAVLIHSRQKEEPLQAYAEAKRSDITVVIDAGHGGIDGGTSSENGDLEKNINLEIALTLNSMLRTMGFKTAMVRTADVSVHDKGLTTVREQKNSDLKNRVRLVEKCDDPVLISIHQNHFSDPSVHGTQVFYSPNNESSAVLAECIKNSVREMLQPDNKREHKKSGSEIYLLHKTKVPAVMVECGFLSNTEECNLLCNEYYQRSICFCIAQGLIDYINHS